MQIIPNFLVVWSLLITASPNAPPVLASSHYYWSQTVCEAAQQRLNRAVVDAGGTPLKATCVPFLNEDATPSWVADNVIGPCEPYYDDCGDSNAADVAEIIGHGQKWYELMREHQKDPTAGPIGPRSFLTPEQRRQFRTSLEQ